MKRILAAGALLGTAVSANAADLPARMYSKAPVMAAVYDWTGFYIGANGGYGLGRNRMDFSAPGVRLDTVYGSPRGGFGGGQIGYNWQTNSSFLGLGTIVYGLEGDIQGSDQRDSYTNLPVTVGNINQRMDFFATARGRVGFATGPMITYITGGYAVANFRTDITNPAGANVLSTDRTRSGYTIGSGVEAALWGNWTGKIEYLYMDFGNRNNGIGPGAVATNVNTRLRDEIFRVGLNYRINGNGASRPWAMPAASNWSGFYLGGNIGGATARDRTSLTGGLVTENFNLMPQGFFGGVQGGYNWQASNWVFGVEVDYQGGRVRDDRTCVFSCTALLGAGYNQRLNEFGTARGRIGYMAGPSLFYFTGGYAYGRVRTDIATTLLGATTNVSFRNDRDGYTVGGGIETPFTFLGLFGPAWTTKTEYLYVDLGRQTNTYALGVPGGGVAAFTNSTRVTEHVFRTGINYHFNSPVVARY